MYIFIYKKHLQFIKTVSAYFSCMKFYLLTDTPLMTGNLYMNLSVGETPTAASGLGPVESIFVNYDVVVCTSVPGVVAHHSSPHKALPAVLVLNTPECTS